MKAPNHKENELNFYLTKPLRMAWWSVFWVFVISTPITVIAGTDVNYLILVAPCIISIRLLFGAQVVLRLTESRLVYSTGPIGLYKSLSIDEINDLEIVGQKIHVFTYTSLKPLVIHLSLIAKEYHDYAKNSTLLWFKECRTCGNSENPLI